MSKVPKATLEKRKAERAKRSAFRRLLNQKRKPQPQATVHLTQEFIQPTPTDPSNLGATIDPAP
jgi:hypothetical protein